MENVYPKTTIIKIINIIIICFCLNLHKEGAHNEAKDVFSVSHQIKKTSHRRIARYRNLPSCLHLLFLVILECFASASAASPPHLPPTSLSYFSTVFLVLLLWPLLRHRLLLHLLFLLLPLFLRLLLFLSPLSPPQLPPPLNAASATQIQRARKQT